MLSPSVRAVALGYGAVTAMRGPYAVGSDAARRNMSEQGESPHPVSALEWIGAQRKVLGPGIAYGVTSSGIAVGDDERHDAAAEHHPIIWSNGKTTRFGSQLGTAYAVSNSGITTQGRILAIGTSHAALHVLVLDPRR